MGIRLKHLVEDMLPQFRRALGNDTAVGPEAKAAKTPSPTRSPEEHAMFDLKAQLITKARTAAQEHGEQFSLEHYRKECETFATTEVGQKMVADKQWNPAIYADLSGQNLDGIRLSDPQAVHPTHTLSQATQKDYDSFDLDGDGQINSPPISQFYDNIRLDGASLREAFVEPATSFNEEVAKAKQLKGLTFSGMGADDSFTFGAGASYQDIRLENINGGHIQFNGTVDGISISGKTASVTIGDHARVSDMQTSDGFSIIHLDVGAGAILANADLSKSTISMTSHFEPGSSLQNVTLSSNLNGLDLSGVNLRNVAIDGKAVTHPSQLPEGVSYDARTTASASNEFIMQTMAHEALGIGVKDFTWKPEMRHPQATETNQTAAAIVTMPSKISGGESVSLADVAIAREVATQVGRLQPETAIGLGMLGSHQA